MKQDRLALQIAELDGVAVQTHYGKIGGRVADLHRGSTMEKTAGEEENPPDFPLAAGFHQAHLNPSVLRCNQ